MSVKNTRIGKCHVSSKYFAVETVIVKTLQWKLSCHLRIHSSGNCHRKYTAVEIVSSVKNTPQWKLSYKIPCSGNCHFNSKYTAVETVMENTLQWKLPYRVAKTHRIPYLYRSFSAKVAYI